MDSAALAEINISVTMGTEASEGSGNLKWIVEKTRHTHTHRQQEESRRPVLIFFNAIQPSGVQERGD